MLSMPASRNVTGRTFSRSPSLSAAARRRRDGGLLCRPYIRCQKRHADVQSLESLPRRRRHQAGFLEIRRCLPPDRCIRGRVDTLGQPLRSTKPCWASLAPRRCMAHRVVLSRFADAVEKHVGITVSIGLAANGLMAKIASGRASPAASSSLTPKKPHHCWRRDRCACCPP